jgi:hypothetical protein
VHRPCTRGSLRHGLNSTGIKSRIASVAFTRRDLSEFDIVYLFVDGMPSGCGPAARASQSSPPTMSASCTSYHRAAVTALCMRK